MARLGRPAAHPPRVCADEGRHVVTKDGMTVRVRVVGDKASLTLKYHAVGLVRHEFEYPIPVGDAETILDTMCGNLVEKTRYRITAAAGFLLESRASRKRHGRDVEYFDLGR